MIGNRDGLERVYVGLAAAGTAAVLPAILVPLYASGAPMSAYLALFPAVAMGVMWGVAVNATVLERIGSE